MFLAKGRGFFIEEEVEAFTIVPGCLLPCQKDHERSLRRLKKGAGLVLKPVHMPGELPLGTKDSMV